jgi:hypothetical protein
VSLTVVPCVKEYVQLEAQLVPGGVILSASGSKVITDSGELGPDLLQALLDGLGRLGDGTMLVRRRPAIGSTFAASSAVPASRTACVTLAR